jgi:hypothetical protein
VVWKSLCTCLIHRVSDEGVLTHRRCADGEVMRDGRRFRACAARGSPVWCVPTRSVRTLTRMHRPALVVDGFERTVVVLASEANVDDGALVTRRKVV